MSASASIFVLLLAAASAVIASASEPGYVAPEICAACHVEIARTYSQTGMSRSFRAVNQELTIPQFDGSSFTHVPSAEKFQFVRRDGIPHVRRSQTGSDGKETNVFEQTVDYVIGSGNHAISYLHRTRDNKLTELPVSWYPENGGHWGMSPAYDRPDHPGFSREVSFACLQCHNAFPAAEVVSESPGETVFPAALPEGIDCQRCHGPGQNHVNAAREGKSVDELRASIVNPKRLSAERQTEVCLQCHLETTSSRLPAVLFRPARGIFSYRPGESLGDFLLSFERSDTQNDSVELVSAPYRLAKSACHQKDGNPLTCATCHDPHLALSPADSSRRTHEVCIACHQKLSGQHPENVKAGCVGCHMPQTPAADVLHASITDHWISKPHASRVPAAEVNARTVPPYAGKVALYYPKVLAQTADDAIAVAVAQVQSNPVEAISRLDQIAGNFRSTRAEDAAEMGGAFLMLAQPQKAIIWYQRALEMSPDNSIYLFGLGSAQQAAGHPDLAADAFARVLTLAPWKTDALLSLGRSYATQSKFDEAVVVLRKAVERNPESAAAYNDLGNALSRISKYPEAETSLREATRLQPEFASIRMNLANLLVHQQRVAEAKEQLKAAIAIGGRAETAESDWFAELLRTGDSARALKTWKQSFDAQVSSAHNNLGTILASENKPDDAIREYRLAVESNPQSMPAQFNLGLTLFNRGLKTEAIPFLTTVAASSDPQMRAAAQSLLDRK